MRMLALRDDLQQAFGTEHHPENATMDEQRDGLCICIKLLRLPSRDLQTSPVPVVTESQGTP